MTQKTEILEQLKKGEAITPMYALTKYGCFRLAAVIYTLRGEGHDIDCVMVDNGSKNKYGRYSLKPGQQQLL